MPGKTAHSTVEVKAQELWERMALCMGVDPRQLWRWRHGASPSGGAMLALVRFATRVPGGLDVLLGEELTAARPDPRR